MMPGMGDMVFIDQISINLAIARPDKSSILDRVNNAAALISGRNGALLEVLPEMEYFRDIVFYFKHAVSGKSSFDPQQNRVGWTPSDATLHWGTHALSKEDARHIYIVRAFHGWNQEFVDIPIIEEEKEKSKFQSFLNLFGSKSPIERQRLSSADATTVVNSLSEKLRKK